MKAILGKKLGMTQLFAKNGELVPVTVIQATPNTIMQVKSLETDGYNAIKVGFEDKKEKNVNRPDLGQFKAAGSAPKRFVKEIRLQDATDLTVGGEITVGQFEASDFIDVTATSKGKGFQGVIKRHNQSRGPMSHGSRYHRRPGSMGAVAPVVFKGKKLAGRMGGTQITTQNLSVVAVDLEQNLLIVKGNVPGPKNGLVFVKQAVKKNVKAREIELLN